MNRTRSQLIGTACIRCCRNISAALAVSSLAPSAGNAYTAAGDRNFPATLVLPQVHLEDSVYFTPSSQAMLMSGSQTIAQSATSFPITYNKTITEQLTLQLADGITRLGATPLGGTEWGVSNFSVLLQYTPIVDQLHEYIISFQIEHVDGGTGSRRVAEGQSSTTPAVVFAKGLGDLPIGYWRPLAITGFVGYQAIQNSQPQVQAGFSVQYSTPYLLSKVANFDLPPFFRGMTPIVEVNYANSIPNRTLQISPGITYTQGTGWELGVEALIPTTRVTGTGLGVIAQLVIQLDYLAPNSFFGRPIFPLHEFQ